MRYLFKHVLMQQAVYDMQLRAHLRQMHRRAAEAIQELEARNLPPHYADLAHHYENAGLQDEAIAYWRKAADFARETYDVEAAARYYRKALSWLPGDEEHAALRLEMHIRLVEVLRWQRRLAEANAASQTMLAIAASLGDAAGQARAWLAWSALQRITGDLRGVLTSAQRAEALAREAGARDELIDALADQSMAHYALGQPAEAWRLGEQSLALCGETDQRKMANCLTVLGSAHWLLGNHRETEQCFRRALELYRAAGNRRGVANTLSNLGANAYKRGDYTTAAEYFQGALAIDREIGNRGDELLHLNNLGGAQAGLARYAAAEENLRRVIDMVGGAGWFELAVTYRFLAEALAGQARLKEALEAAQRSLSLAQAMDRQQHVGEAWRVLGTVVARLGGVVAVDGQACAASACFARSLDVFAQLGAEGERARTLRAWAQYEIADGDRERGQLMLRQAFEVFERLGLALEMERCAP